VDGERESGAGREAPARRSGGENHGIHGKWPRCANREVENGRFCGLLCANCRATLTFIISRPKLNQYCLKGGGHWASRT